MRPYLLLLTTALCLNYASAATNLITVYQQALDGDPSYQTAHATWLAAKEAVPQSRANLLPTLSASASQSRERLRKIDNTENKYNNKSMQLNVSQPIFNFAAWAGLRGAKATVKQAAAIYAAAEQDLILRVATAYFDVLLKQDLLRFTQSRETSTARQLEQSEERYHVGLTTITSVYQARAGHDEMTAALIGARNDLQNSRETLRQITGHYYDELLPLQDKLALPTPIPNNIEAWVTMATQNNLQLVAARYGAQAAKAKARQLFGGHLPTLNLTGSISEAETGVGGPMGEIDNKLRTIGVTLALPLYQGGLVASQVRQAKQEYLAAEHTIKQNYRAAELQARKNYNSSVAQLSKINADRQTIISNQSSVESTETAYRLGTNTIIDILETQKNLFEAQKDLAQDQYTFINNLLTLKQAAGSLSLNDLQMVDGWLLKAVPLKKTNTTAAPEKHSS